MSYSRISLLDDDFKDIESASVDSLRDAWIEQRDSLAESGVLSRFNERLLRRWSIETGIIERLYTLDRGTTELLIQRGLDTAFIEHGASDLPASDLITLLSDHEKAATYVVDHVAQRRGLTTSFIKSLHQLLTQHQDHTDALDQFGNYIKVPLLKGKWKESPNNPKRPDGTMHMYCPPHFVADEIEHLIAGYEELGRKKFTTIIKTSWLHHCFTQIHPFQDGNGRVARAIAAYALIADGCFPIVVDRDSRSDYIKFLEQADKGDLRPLIRMFARLEKQELEQALSLSQDVLHEDFAGEGAFRSKLMEAFRSRVRERREAVTAKHKSVIDTGTKIFDTVIMKSVNAIAQEIDFILKSELPGSSVRVEQSGIDQQHFFKKQLVEIARRERYYSDFETFHKWVRLRFERQAEQPADKTVNEIVISLHSLGRHFNGVLTLSAYFATRMLDEAEHSVTLEPKSIADRSLTFSHQEPKENVSARTEEWVGRVLNMGLAELLRAF